MYCSNLWLVHLVCLSPSRWYPEVKFRVMSNAFPSEWKKWDTNLKPQSDVMWDGTSCLEKMCRTNNFVSSVDVIVLRVGMNIACLVSRSTTTRIAVYLEDWDNFLMKSIEIEFQGCSGTGSCLRNPYGLWCWDLECIQVVQDLQMSLMKVQSPSHIYLRQIINRVLFWPKCPKCTWLCLYCSTQSQRFLVLGM